MRLLIIDTDGCVYLEEPESCFKALSDETRYSIVMLLLRYNFCVGALANRLDISEAAVSQHLKVLRECDLVVGKKGGYFMHYEVNREKLRDLAQSLLNASDLERLPCDPAMERCSIKKRCMCHADKRCKGCDCCKDCRLCHERKTEQAKS